MESGLRQNKPENADKYKQLHIKALENRRIAVYDLDLLPEI